MELSLAREVRLPRYRTRARLRRVLNVRWIFRAAVLRLYRAIYYRVLIFRLIKCNMSYLSFGGEEM